MTRASPPPTRRRLLRAACDLYARDGVGATSVRAIIRGASANLNAIHYHFGSKLALTSELFREVMAPLSEERRELLGLAAAAPPSTRGAATAVWWPVIRRAAAGSAEDRRRISIVNQLRVDPSDEARAVLAEHQETFAPAFEALLEQTTGLAGPELGDLIRFANEAFWGLAGQLALRVGQGEEATAGDEAAARARFDRLCGFVEAAARDLATRD